jgi:hypothetical protein
MPQTKEQKRASWAKHKDRLNAERRLRYKEDAEYREKVKASRSEGYKRHHSARLLAAGRRRAVTAVPERDYKLRLAYGLSLAEYDRLLEWQGGGCAICGGTSGRRLHVDHDHKNPRQVRGLLCNGCNNGLGRFRDDPELLRMAIGYLEAWNDPGLKVLAWPSTKPPLVWLTRGAVDVKSA